MHHSIPIYHGLLLSQKILGRDFPRVANIDASKIGQDYEAGLTILAQAIEAKAPKVGSYGDVAVKAWEGLIRE